MITLIGPWTFDRIWMPTEYICSFPNIRLDENFCGLPQSGVWLLTWAIDSFISLATGFVMGQSRSSGIAREIVFFLLLLFPALPFFTTLILIQRENRHLKFHVLAWVLAIGVGLWLSHVSSPWTHPALWGVWLYIGLGVCVLVLERLAFAVSRKPSQVRCSAWQKRI